jgi:hypothetical protein
VVAVGGATSGSEAGTVVGVRTGCLWATAEFATFLQARFPTNCSSGYRKLLRAVSGRQLGVGVWASRAADEQTRARAETAILGEHFMIMHLSKLKCDFPSLPVEPIKCKEERSHLNRCTDVQAVQKRYCTVWEVVRETTRSKRVFRKKFRTGVRDCKKP